MKLPSRTLATATRMVGPVVSPASDRVAAGDPTGMSGIRNISTMKYLRTTLSVASGHEPQVTSEGDVG